jgi:hypothetical protein
LCRNWILVEEVVEARNVNGILGLLCREHFPGLVYKSEEDVKGEYPRLTSTLSSAQMNVQKLSGSGDFGVVGKPFSLYDPHFIAFIGHS